MPAPERKAMWGDIDEEEDDGLPPPVVTGPIDGIKTVVEYRINADTKKKEKITRTFRVELARRKITPAVAARKKWAKYGDSARDPPGPNSGTTIVSDDVFLTLTSQSADLDAADGADDPLKKLANQRIVTCRICKGDHFTLKCPYKDSLAPPTPAAAEEAAGKPAASTAAAAAGPGGMVKGKYVPPSMRDGGNRRGESMKQRQVDDAATVRVTNLSEDVREPDLQDLFRPFGTVQRIFLAKDKNTNQSKGFAFVSYLRKEDAARAIEALSGYGYDHLILQVEWAKPPSAEKSG
eukprot:comp9251_c1_seq1/m.4374 comp9251_c1_seq1/g.4374  ORF comp9251_c1_seq1/g.4374 comp9251_c1_seq1/m.4374 type:complete len:293 (-) comp9251_c1_seq1:131-1009(-)